MENINNLFLELLQIGFGKKENLSRIPSDTEWQQLFEISQVQTVAGVAFDGILKLGERGIKPPFNLLMEWIGVAEHVTVQNKVHTAVLKKVINCLKDKEVDTSFMKGQVVGTRYPNPDRRQCGDIDFVVAEKDFDRTLDALEQIGEVDRSLIHEHHGMAFVDRVQLEPHYKVHNFQNPKVDKAMREMFSEVFPSKLIKERIGDTDVPTFPPVFECALLVGHMVNHVYAEGLGLRQVVDFMMFLEKKYSELDKKECLRYLRMLRMERAFRVFSFICEKYLGLSHAIVAQKYTSSEKTFSDKLMNDILIVGNFGRGQDYLGKNRMMRPLKSYLWVTMRCVKLGYLCPAEARWWPLSKFMRFLWKRSKREE